MDERRCYENHQSPSGPPHGPPPPSDVWNEWMRGLACLMRGNWYSTQAVSACKSPADTDCWWRLHSPAKGDREINASCADERVQQALRKRRPKCWAACGDQADNVTAL